VRHLREKAARHDARPKLLEPDLAASKGAPAEDPWFVDVTEDLLRHGMAFLIDGPPR